MMKLINLKKVDESCNSTHVGFVVRQVKSRCTLGIHICRVMYLFLLIFNSTQVLMKIWFTEWTTDEKIVCLAIYKELSLNPAHSGDFMELSRCLKQAGYIRNNNQCRQEVCLNYFLLGIICIQKLTLQFYFLSPI